MTTTDAQFEVEAKLTGVQPKAGKPDSYDDAKKGNTLVLTLEVNLPAPTPPMSFDKWIEDYRGGGYQLKSKLTRELQEFADKARKKEPKLPKPVKGTHWYEVEATTACKVCGQDAPDNDTTTAKCLDPVAQIEGMKAQTESGIRVKQDELSAQLRDAFDDYFSTATNKMNRAFIATLSSGLFVSMLGQMVQVSLKPSSQLFQPMLDATFAMQKQIEPLALAVAQVSALEAAHGEDGIADPVDHIAGAGFDPGDDDGEGADEE